MAGFLCSMWCFLADVVNKPCLKAQMPTRRKARATSAVRASKELHNFGASPIVLACQIKASIPHAMGAELARCYPALTASASSWA